MLEQGEDFPLPPEQKRKPEKFWHKEELTQAVQALQEGRTVLICGPWSSGKTILAEAAATSIEPDRSKRQFSFLVNSPKTVGLRLNQGVMRRIEESKPSVAVVDEVTINTLDVADRMAAIAEDQGTKLVFIYLSGKDEVEGEKVREELSAKAKENKLEHLGKLARELEVIALPDPEWRETGSVVVPKVSERYGGDFHSPSRLLSQVRNSERLKEMLRGE